MLWLLSNEIQTTGHSTTFLSGLTSVIGSDICRQTPPLPIACCCFSNISDFVAALASEELAPGW